MDRAQIDWHWMRHEPIEGAAFTLNHPVHVTGGPYAGASGSVVSLLTLDPEPGYLVELGTGGDVELSQSQLRSALSEQPGSALAELQHWYATQTDTDWEHSYGIRIETLDNPGWRVEIDLADTELFEHPFDEVSDLESAQEWIICRVEAGKFTGSAGPLMLEEIIRTFLRWARTAPQPRA
jgi:hypothetical protein